MGRSLVFLAGWLAVGFAPAATLEKLSLERMVRESTEIVRGKVLDSSTQVRGPMLYTQTRIQVVERWKGAEAATVTVSVPGGRSGNVRQVIPGAPSLTPGAEYVLFLWTGRSGITQVIGLSQGVFSLDPGSQGQPAAARAASSETMLDATGKVVADSPVRMTLAELDRAIRATLGEER